MTLRPNIQVERAGNALLGPGASPALGLAGAPLVGPPSPTRSQAGRGTITGTLWLARRAGRGPASLLGYDRLCQVLV